MFAKLFKLLIFISLLFLTSCYPVLSTKHLQSEPVVLDNKTIFEIKTGTEYFTPEIRAKIISERLSKLAQNPSFEIDSISIKNMNNNSYILSNNKIITTVTEKDARAEGLDREKLAQDYTNQIKKAIEDYRTARSLKNIIIDLLDTIILTILFILSFGLLKYLLSNIIAKIESWKDTVISPFKIQNYELLTVDRIFNILMSTIKTFEKIAKISLFLLYLIIVSSFFPWTADFSTKIKDNFFLSVNNIFNSILNYLPNLLFIIIISILTYYLNKFIEFIFIAISAGKISFSGFYREWADITSKIVRFLIVAIVIAIIFPHLPGAESGAFKGLSIFLGVILSLGSTFAISNIIAGIILTYTRAYKTGDRLKIADAIGDVTEKTLLVTRLKTVKSEIISIPNSVVIASHIVNYSYFSEDTGLILHTEVSIGYSTPWRKVHELLTSAASATEHILSEPVPFVLQTRLNDFYITYQLNAYTDKPNLMERTYSELHKNIQDKFNEAGLEIMSPHFSALRDGNTIAIPQNYIQENYNSPSFKVNNAEKQ